MARQRPLRLEELGARVVPSATQLVPAHPPASVLISDALRDLQLHQLHHFHLDGHGSGNYTATPTKSDAGVTYHLLGETHLAGLGDVGVSGTLHSVGFVKEGHAAGQLTFANAKGTITVELTGPLQPGFSALPHKFAYKIVSGTGAYKGISGQGELTLKLTPAPASKGGGLRGSFSLSA